MISHKVFNKQKHHCVPEVLPEETNYCNLTAVVEFFSKTTCFDFVSDTFALAGKFSWFSNSPSDGKAFPESMPS